MTVKVLVDDNYHYMDSSHRYLHGEFDTPEAALVAAKKVVDDYLDEAHSPGMTAEALFGSYKMFGEDPFVVGGDVHFSAWEYAKARCAEICAGS
jgi:hypothetical protein